MVSYISLYVFAEFSFSFTHHLLLLRRIEVSNPSPTLIIIKNMQPNPSSETPRLNRAVVFVHSAFRKITRKKAGKKEDQDFLNRVSAAEELRFQEFLNTYAVSEEDCDNSSDVSLLLFYVAKYILNTSAAVVRFSPVQRVLDENQEPNHGSVLQNHRT